MPPAARTPEPRKALFELHEVEVHYGAFRAVHGVSMQIHPNEITALIGPSGCGKTTVLKCLNRMNDLTRGARVLGRVIYRGVDLYGADVAVTEVRRRIGMVFQKPTPFPTSVYDNVAYGLRIDGRRRPARIAARVEKSLRAVALWDEVKDRLHHSALAMSGGQQQRMCIARALAVQPEVVLMDEPCSSLDPISTARIEDLMRDLKETYAIVIVTHNMQQAARVSDRTAFFTVDVDEAGGKRTGMLVECDDTAKLFSQPRDQRTESYISGRFG